MKQLGETKGNVSFHQDETEPHILHVKIDLRQALGITSSAKNVLLANTGGPLKVHVPTIGDVTVNISGWREFTKSELSDPAVLQARGAALARKDLKRVG